ncbi:MAG: outer membrane beta-barrel protein [Pseudomonadota bacterium]
MLSALVASSLNAPAIAQEALPEGEEPPVVDELEKEDPIDEGGEDALEETDPRTILRQERERRERIESLIRAQPNIPQEGAVLAGPNVPPSLLPGRGGLTYGKVAFSPRATVGALLTDNVNSDDDDREDDVIFGANASVRADALMRRHALGAEASITGGSSLEGAEDDFLDWLAGVDGRYDLTRRSSLNAAVSGTVFQEDDSSIAAEGDEATVTNLSANSGYVFNGRRWDFGLGVNADIERFSDESSDDRDNDAYTLSAQVSHQLSRRFSIFASPQYTLNEFDGVGGDGEDRDSTELTGLVGVDAEISPRLRFGASAGYSQAFFDDPDLEENGSFVGSLNARYAYDARTNYRLSASRSFDVTTVDDASTEISTVVTGEVTKLLAPKHAVTLQAIYTNSDFDDGDRTDHDITGALGYFFRFNPNFVFNLGYQYLTRISDEDDEEFYENQIVIGVTVAY